MSNLEDNRATCGSLFDKSLTTGRRMCRPHFDGSLCWGGTDLDSTAKQECPFKFCSDCGLPEEERMATRQCFSNGTWSDPNYDHCVVIYFNTSCIEKTCSPCADPFRQTLMSVTLALSILSVLTLLTSVSLFSWLKSIHCRRLTIHANLALAFVLRFTTYTIWILLQRDQVLQGCGSHMTKEVGDYLCKVILFFIMYSTLASTFWMFVEGAYLVSRFSIYAMRASDGPLWLYLLVGWAAPLLFVSIWAISLELQPSVQFCWVPYTTTWALWFLVGPMSVALVLNVLFLIVVIVVVIQKMHTARSSESAKIWQTIKSTLLLVPLLGVSNLLLFYEPSERETLAFKIYLLFTAVLQHSQGIFVAILYCFANGEVQDALKRECKKLNITRQLRHKASTARSVSIVTSPQSFLAACNHNNQDQNEPLSPPDDRPCNQCKKHRRLILRGKSNSIRNEGSPTSIESQTKMAAASVCVSQKDLPPTTPFFSKNSPIIHAQYESCVIFDRSSTMPKVIITAPDDDDDEEDDG